MTSNTRVAQAYMERRAMSADSTYKSRAREVKQMLRDLDKALKQHEKAQKGSPEDWNYVGDLNALRSLFGEALQRMNGR